MKLKESDFSVQKLNDCWRISLISDDKYHSHITSKRILAKILKCITTCKLPLDEDFRFYESIYRLLPFDDDYKRKVSEIMDMKNKHSDYYFNPSRKCKG
jgi:hypothetical protein